jgi:hypothetical protein
MSFFEMRGRMLPQLLLNWLAWHILALLDRRPCC